MRALFALVFVFKGRYFFLSLELVEIRLYLGASLLVGIIILGGVTFIVSYVSYFTAY